MVYYNDLTFNTLSSNDFLINSDNITPSINMNPITRYGKDSIPVFNKLIAKIGPSPAPINKITVWSDNADPHSFPPI